MREIRCKSGTVTTTVMRTTERIPLVQKYRNREGVLKGDAKSGYSQYRAASWLRKRLLAREDIPETECLLRVGGRKNEESDPCGKFWHKL